MAFIDKRHTEANLGIIISRNRRYGKICPGGYFPTVPFIANLRPDSGDLSSFAYNEQAGSQHLPEEQQDKDNAHEPYMHNRAKNARRYCSKSVVNGTLIKTHTVMPAAQKAGFSAADTRTGDVRAPSARAAIWSRNAGLLIDSRKGKHFLYQ